jgi:sigma-E factor negative regulatory protein RseC
LITEPATVLEVRGDTALVRCHSQAACQRCAEGRGCGGGALSRLLGERLHVVEAATGGLDLRPGDEVTVGLEPRGFLHASAAVYFLPLVTALGGALIGTAWFGAGDAVALAGAVAGLAAGLAWARGFGRRRSGDGRFRPRVIDRLAPDVPTASVEGFLG